jgi:hypothetical protein
MNKDTVAMLNRLHDLGVRPDEALALRRISMTLHRWHELECGDANDYASWSIVRGRKETRHGQHSGGHGAHYVFVHDDKGKPYIERHIHTENGARYEPIPDREAGARRRLHKIVNQLLARGVTLGAYIQTDPRGCALYMLPPGATEENYNSRGVAVHQ